MLTDCRTSYERRIRQFAECLRPMRRRAQEEAHGPCFMIFNERPPDDNEARRRRTAREIPVTTAVAVEVGAPGEGLCFVELWPLESEPRGREGGDPFGRYIQFSFEQKWFCIDMPNATLSRRQAEEVMECRNGFFYVQGMPQFELEGEGVQEWDPLRKVYLYGDEASAAEDMAFVFFQVWNFSVSTRLYVASAAFGGNRRWEDGVPID